MRDTIKIGFQYSPEMGEYGFWIRRLAASKTQMLTENGYSDSPPGEYRQASFYVQQVNVEDLMSQLWAEGFRPKDWGTEGELAAVRKHLNDERCLRQQLLSHLLRKSEK